MALAVAQTPFWLAAREDQVIPLWFTGERLVLDPGPGITGVISHGTPCGRHGSTVTQAGAVHGNGDGSVMLARKEGGPVGDV